jgi:hypothetical protein
MEDADVMATPTSSSLQRMPKGFWRSTEYVRILHAIYDYNTGFGHAGRPV